MTTPVLGSIDHLHKKIKSWTPEISLEFHGPAEKAYPEKSHYIWEDQSTDNLQGFVHYGPEMATYYTAHGQEMVLTSCMREEQPFDKIWQANKELCLLGQKNKTFRMVDPTGFRVGFAHYNVRYINLDNVNYTYYKIVHPNNELGWDSNFSQDFDEYLAELVDDTAVLLSNLKTVVDSKIVIGYPSIKTCSRLSDSVGSYWRFFYRWNISAEGCLARILGELQKDLQGLERNGWTGNSDDIEEQAREKWQTALNI